MQALVKYAPGDGNVELRDVPEPQCTERQVKVEVHCCGICGTDLHVLHDRFRNFPPVILGHEFAGTVVEVGKSVAHVRCGERVCVLGATAVTCGECDFCRRGEFMHCPQRRGMGHGVDGALARYVVVRPDQLYRLPAELPLEQGALVEPLAAAVHAVCEVAEVRPGQVALVSGPGPIGLLCLMLLVRQGIPTIVAGAAGDSTRLDLARRLGALAAVEAARDDLGQAVRDLSGGRGIDLAFECAGVGASAQACLEWLRPFGQYVQVGHFGRPIELNFDRVAFRQLQIRGSVGYTAETWDRTLRILDRGLPVSGIVTHRLPLARWAEGFALCETKAGLKVLLHPESDSG